MERRAASVKAYVTQFDDNAAAKTNDAAAATGNVKSNNNNSKMGNSNSPNAPSSDKKMNVAGGGKTRGSESATDRHALLVTNLRRELAEMKRAAATAEAEAAALRRECDAIAAGAAEAELANDEVGGGVNECECVHFLRANTHPHTKINKAHHHVYRITNSSV